MIFPSVPESTPYFVNVFDIINKLEFSEDFNSISEAVKFIDKMDAEPRYEVTEFNFILYLPR